MSGAHAEVLLRACQPYMVVKAKQAEVALAFRSHAGSRGKPVSDVDVAAREALRLQLVELNRRGAVA